jgi:hypothetical protein
MELYASVDRHRGDGCHAGMSIPVMLLIDCNGGGWDKSSSGRRCVMDVSRAFCEAKRQGCVPLSSWMSDDISLCVCARALFLVA